MNKIDKALLKIKIRDDYKYRGYEIKEIPNACNGEKEIGYSIYKNGKFICSVGTEQEGMHEIDDIENRETTITYDLVNADGNLFHESKKVLYKKKDEFRNELERKYPKRAGWSIVNYKVRDSFFKINKALDALGEKFYRLEFHPSNKVEGIRIGEDLIDQYAKDLLKKYGDKRVSIYQGGRIYKTFLS